MVGIKSRSTFYRHIKRHSITIEKDEDGNPLVDVSELTRVYGDKVKTPEQLAEAGKESEQSPKQAGQGASQDDTIELAVLKEKLNAEQAKTAFLEERLQIADDQNKSFNNLLEDQSREKDKLRQEALARREQEQVALDRYKKERARLVRQLARYRSMGLFQRLFAWRTGSDEAA